MESWAFIFLERKNQFFSERVTQRNNERERERARERKELEFSLDIMLSVSDNLGLR
jgi:hypothetical protein